MMSQTRIQISASHETEGLGVAQFQIPAAAAVTNTAFQQDRITITESDPVDIPLGEITTPGLLVAYNADADNYIDIRDDADDIARLYPRQSCIIPLPAGVDLKAQADTADADLIYAVFEYAS